MSNIYVIIARILGTHTRKWLLLILLIIPVLLILKSSIWSDKLWLDNDPLRGAGVVQHDVFGDKYSKVVYPSDQGWSASDSLWFYNTTQGSDLIPYDFFLVLENASNEQAFRSAEHMNQLRYLPQAPTKSNPDGLPVGMVKDEYLGKTYMGFSCAACHTGQVNVNGMAIRIDGGPAGADMPKLMHELASALDATLSDPSKKTRFYANVKALGHYNSDQAITDDLNLYATRIHLYNYINHSDTEYGYARLDAFGRIYNRVLQHVMTEGEIRDFLKEMPCNASVKLDDLQCTATANAAAERFDASLLQADQSRAHIVERIMESLGGSSTNRFNPPSAGQEIFKQTFFNSPNAPVSYPFLWDIPQHDYVQWNAIASNAGFGPIGRNTGEVIGVFASLDWQKRKFTPFFHHPIEATREHVRALIGGQGLFASEYVDFTSSVNTHNLERIERHLATLKSPNWKDPALANILPVLDEKKVHKGAVLFDQHCAACHDEVNRSDPDRRIVANMTKLSLIGTDPKMADNSVDYVGHSGMIKNLYVGVGPGDILLKEKAPVAGILTKSTLNAVATPDPDQWFFTRFGYWAYNLIEGFFENDIKPSLKAGDYTPDASAQPLASLKAYKGRSLNGIWATAPYLHNGSVPTLYDLLLPAEQRPKVFMVGSRELDIEKVGFKHEGYEGFKFDTSKTANSNAGHEYGTHDIKLPNSEVLKALSEEDRWALVEYLKNL